MSIAFVFPSDELNPFKIDPVFEDQAQALSAQGFSVWPIRIEEGKIFSKGESLEGKTIVYRGWMLSEIEYIRYRGVIQDKGAKLFTSIDSYFATHHIPNWYPLIGDLTPETVFFSKTADLNEELSKLGWGQFVLKDYVKSLKTGSGSIISSPEQASEVARQMEHFRGKIEGGFSVRRYENLLPETETRYFVIDGKSFGQRDEIPLIIQTCAGRLHSFSRFFSIDLATRDDGVSRIVEVGDGQVSDIVGWSADRFADIWKQHRT